jgi:succinate-acetate transporter protein
MADSTGFDKVSANGESLTRQVTLTLTPEQYERLFFQPSAPARGDLAKRLGNPTLLGTMGFLIPFTTTMMCLLQWRGSGPNSFNSISGSWFFLGGIAMNIAGICEFILGNSESFLAKS